MKKWLLAGSYLLLPSMLTLMFATICALPNIEEGIGNGFIGLAIALTFVGFCLLAERKPSYQWLLPFGFLLTPLPVYIVDYYFSKNGFGGKYFVTSFVAYFYTFPTTLISAIMVFIFYVRKYARTK